MDATNVQVTDYIPAGLTLNDANWSAVNGKATLNSVIASLPAGQSVSRNITFTVGSGVTGSLTNTAEISSATGGTDKDSSPDNDPTNDGTPVNDDTSGDHKNNPSQDEDDSDIEVITVTPVVCVKPVLTVGNPICAGNGTYTVSFFSSVGSINASVGMVSGNTVSGIPVGTPVVITAMQSASCLSTLTVQSPVSCSSNPGCTSPQLTVGQPICNGNGTYTVSFEANKGMVSVNAGTISGNAITGIPVGTNLIVTATDGTCVTRVNVVSPVSCTNPCDNPGISLSGPLCDDKGTNTYYLYYTLTAGASVKVSQGVASNGLITGVPSGMPLSLTVSMAGCPDKVVTIPGLTCGSTPAPSLDLTKQVDKRNAGLGEVVTYTLTVTNNGNGAATNVVVQEAMSAGLSLVPGSVVTSMGSYSPQTPVSLWTLTNLPAGATATLTFSASITQVGVVYNTAVIPGDTATVCTTVPVKVCKGAAIQVALSAPAGYASYQWLRNGVAIAGATSYTYTATQLGEFTVQVNNGQCPNGACCPILVQEEEGINYTLASTAPTCNGSQPLANGSIMINGVGNTSYRYAITLGTSFSTTNPATQPVPAGGLLASNLAGGQTYTIRVFNAAGCWQDQTVTIGVANCGCSVEPPVVVCAITEVCKGGSTTLSTRGCASGTVIWSNGQTGATIFATPSVTTTYTASCVMGGCTSGASNAITVTILEPRMPTITASANTICPGTSVTLTASGCEGGVIEWSEKAQRGSSIVVVPYGKTTYTAQCRLGSCLSNPAGITIDVNTDLPTPTVTCSTTIVCPGETVTLTAENCVGTPIWNSTTATTSSIVVTPTAASNSYWVYCKKDACTSKSSNVYTIAVVSPVIPTITASADTICTGGQVVLTATNCNGEVMWSTGQTGTSITVSPTANISYYAQCKFRSCLSVPSSAVAVAVVNPQTPIVKVSKTLICSGEPVSLTASGCQGTVQWYGVAKVGAIVEVYPTSTTEYYATCKQGNCESSASNTVRVTVNTSPATAPTVVASTTTVCGSGVVSLTATGCNGTVKWSDGQAGSVITVTATPTNREFYALCIPASGTACGSAKSNVITISVPSTPTPTIVASQTSVCAGENVTLTASGCAGGIVQWYGVNQTGTSIQVSPAATTEYYATCKVSSCESAPSNKVTVVVNSPATAPVVTASSLTVCSGSVVSLTATGCANGTVRWSDGQTGSVITVTATATNHDFYALCRVGSQCSSPRSNLVSISLAPTAAPVIAVSRTSVCSGEKVSLTATGCSGTVTWYGITRTGASIDIYPTATTEYYATCKVGTCESAPSNKVSVVVNTSGGTAPVITASTQSVCASGVVSMTATGCNGTVIWSDGQQGAIVSVTATAANHEFYALCKANDQCGTAKSNVITITVTSLPTPKAVCSTDSICPGEEVTLTVQDCQGTPHWNTGETTTSIIVKPTVTMGYMVYCTMNGCSSPTSKSYVITVVPTVPPTITASATAVTAGGSVTLTATGCVGTVIWSATDIYGNNTGTSIVVRPNGTQTYYAQCKYRICLSDPSIPIVINPGNCIVKAGGLTAVNEKVCASTSTTAIVAATPNGGLIQPGGYSVAYLLAKDGVVTQIGTSPQFTVPSENAHYVIHTLVYNASPGDANYVTLSSINPGVTRTSDVLQLISAKCAALDVTGAAIKVCVVGAPTIPTTPLVVCNGATVSLTATGCDGGTVKWSDGKEGAVYETSVYSERWLTAICEVDGCPSKPSASLHISLGTPAVPIIVSTPSVCVGETVSLTATGCATGGYVWSDGTTTGPILTVTPSQDVSYRVKCTLSSCEGEWSATTTIHVGKPSAPTISVQGNGSTTVCYGAPITLVAMGCGANSNVIWSNNRTGSSITVSPASTETFTAYCYGNTNCKSDASNGVTVTVLSKVITPTVVDRVNTCPITTVDLSTAVVKPASTTGGVFAFYTDAALTTKVANPAAVGTGVYYVIERTVNGCASLPAAINVQITTCTDPTPCTNPATANAGADASICAANSYQVRGIMGGGGQTAHWTTSGKGTFDNPYSLSAIYTASVEDIQAGQVILTLSVTTSNANCPVVTDQMTLTINGVRSTPVITVVGATQLCYGDSVILRASEAFGYRWNTGATTRSIVVKQSGVYSVQVMDDKGCSSVKSAEVSVKVADPVLPPLVTNLRNTCPSKIVDLTKALSSTTAGSSYIYRICECVTSNIVIRPDSVCEGTYWIVEKTAQGCVSHPSKVVVKVFNCATDTLTADVSIVKTVNRTLVNGSPVTYTLTVSNAGPHTAYNVDVRDVLPNGLQLLAGTSPAFSFTNGVITKRIDSLKAGASTQLVFTARVVKKGEDIVNTAEITYLDNKDTNLANNSSSVSVRDTSSSPVSQTYTPGIGLALAVVKVAQQPDNSYNVTYKATLKNFGSVDLSGVSLLDSLGEVFVSPASYSVVSGPVVGAGSSLVANTSFDGNTQPNLLGAASTLAAGVQDTVVFVVNVKTNGNSGPFYSSATAQGTTLDGNQTVKDVSNNGFDPTPEGSVSTTVRFDLPSGLLGVAKSAGTPTNVSAGIYDIPYTIALSNMGRYRSNRFRSWITSRKRLVTGP
ncbi:hypothetical protein [Spirosoma telluris]|uniref:Ig-like domain-containing protein n=1 Tax=Spirosoma telluris TaxID=2183553 RepID=UPI002FC2EAB5